MTQRIFDVENEQDMQDLWSILPSCINCIHKDDIFLYIKNKIKLFNINWHKKTEITRPITEATTNDLGKLCVFWNEDNVESYGILTSIRTHVTNDTITYVKNGYDEFEHCRRLTKQEIEELC